MDAPGVRVPSRMRDRVASGSIGSGNPMAWCYRRSNGADDVRFRQRDEVLSLEASLTKFGDQLVGDVPGQQQRKLRLVLEETRLVHDRHEGSGHVLANLVRVLHLDHTVENLPVEADITDQGARTRWRAHSVDVAAAPEQILQERVQLHF